MAVRGLTLGELCVWGLCRDGVMVDGLTVELFFENETVDASLIAPLFI